MSQVYTIEELSAKVDELQRIVDSIVKGHKGDTRDELKSRVELIEIKLNSHLKSQARNSSSSLFT